MDHDWRWYGNHLRQQQYIYTDPISIIIINNRTVGIWCDTVKSTIYHYNSSDSSCEGLLHVQWILSSITAGSPMVGTLTPLKVVVASGSCSSVAEHWHGKPMALGWFPAAPPFFPALSPFQRSMDSNYKIRSLIRPWLIGLWTRLIGVPTMILLKIHCNYYYIILRINGSVTYVCTPELARRVLGFFRR